ncbi:MAG TPA: nuclear transport factor 2 family protein [Gammaproteobacteria bacterium]
MAAAVSPEDTIAIRLAIEELNAAFAHHLDHGDIDALVDLFTVDALYTHGARRSQGRDEIEALFRNRVAKGPRTSRHLYSGLRIAIESATEATGTSVCLSFAADGLPPLPAKPFLVADFVDRYRRDEHGRWRFAERHIERVFVGEDS